MNCNKCNKPVEEDLIRHFDTIPPMQGYNYIPPCARCVGCRLPVCQECMWGLGMFMFICREECKPLWDAFMEDKTQIHPFARCLKKFYEAGTPAEEVAILTNTKQETIESVFNKRKERDDKKNRV